MSVVSSWQAGDALSVSRDVFSKLREENVPFMAGSVAYSAFVSLFPLLLLLLLVASAIGGRVLATYVVDLTGSYLTPTGQALLTDATYRAGSSTGISIVGVVVLGATAIALVAIVAAGAVFALFPRIPYVWVLNPLLLVIGLTIVFFPVYHVYPDLDLSPRAVLPGTAFAAVGWAVLSAVFQVYVSFSSTAELYGVIGGVLLVITWLYFAALVPGRRHGERDPRRTARAPTVASSGGVTVPGRPRVGRDRGQCSDCGGDRRLTRPTP